MPLQIGIIGLPNVGKSTLFRALTKQRVDCANYPFCTIDPNVGVVAVPDERLAALAARSQSAKVVPTTIEFVDIAGLVAGAHAGEGLGNKFLANIRETDAIAEVVRVFASNDVVHVSGRVDPVSDVETINLELAMADLATVHKRMETVSGKAKSGDKAAQHDLGILQRYEAQLNAGRPIRELAADDTHCSPPLALLTAKPLLYVLNVDDRDQLAVTEDEWRRRLPFLGSAPFVALSVKLEAELVEMLDADAAAMRAELGLPALRGLDRLIRGAYDTLNLLTYFTSGPTEARAWTVPRGTKAPQAAGVIHTDFEKGFIRAEVIDWKDFVKHGEAKCKELGKMRLEGKAYEMRDGDTVFFHVAA